MIPVAKVPYVDLPGLHRPLKARYLAAIGKVFDHGGFILGPEVRDLEERLAERLKVPAVVSVGSGADALVLALRLRGIGAGDEVLTVSHSFVATATSIELVGATPKFVDLDPHSHLLDPQLLEAAITPRTRAVIPVHLNGFPCDLDAVEDVCRRYGLALIEDAAQAIGVTWRGEPVGGRELGCFSVHPLKILAAAGDGGFVACRDPADAERLRVLRNHGLRDRDHCDESSYNSRLDTVQAAMLMVGLDAFDEWLEIRRDHAAAYRSALAGRDDVVLPMAEDGFTASYSAFVIRHRRRDALQAALDRRGVDAKVHYPLAIHQQQAFVGLGPFDLPVTEQLVGEILSLPVHAALAEGQRQRVIDATLESLDEIAASHE